MGSIYKRISSQNAISWQVLIRKRGFQTISKTFPNEKLAKEFVLVTEADMLRGRYIHEKQEEQITFKELLEKYRKEVVPTKKAGKPLEYKLGVVLNSFLSKKTLSAIKAVDIAKYRDMRLKQVSKTTVSHELALISHVFNVAIKKWGFEKIANPVDRIDKPGFNRARERRLTEEEIVAIKKATESKVLASIIDFALETAMREAEIASIHFSDVDFKSFIVTLEETKNGDKRIVPLTHRALEIIRSFKSSDISNDSVFSITAHAVSVAFRRAVGRARTIYERECKEKNLVPDTRFLVDIHFHDLRHEAISRLTERGDLNLFQIKAISGHRTTQMLGRYTHVKTSDLVAILNKNNSQNAI